MPIYSLGVVNISVSVDSNYFGFTNLCLDVHVLMSVQEKAWFGPFDIMAKRLESKMNSVINVVNMTR
jgi:hypothetical protein